MSDDSRVRKDEQNQMSVPRLWRKTFIDVVEAFKEGDTRLVRGVKNVSSISRNDAEIIANNIADYGCQLVSLPDKTWQTSACQWMDGYWDVLIDLYTAEEGASDLVLSVRVYEGCGSYKFEIQSVYVP